MTVYATITTWRAFNPRNFPRWYRHARRAGRGRFAAFLIGAYMATWKYKLQP